MAPDYDALAEGYEEEKDSILFGNVDFVAEPVEFEGALARVLRCSSVAPTSMMLSKFTGGRVEGYPTLYLFKKGEKSKPVKYEGGGQLSSMQNFVAAETGLLTEPDEEDL